jgi:hypothetical protein
VHARAFTRLKQPLVEKTKEPSRPNHGSGLATGLRIITNNAAMLSPAY